MQLILREQGYSSADFLEWTDPIKITEKTTSDPETFSNEIRYNERTCVRRFRGTSNIQEMMKVYVAEEDITGGVSALHDWLGACYQILTECNVPHLLKSGIYVYNEMATNFCVDLGMTTPKETGQFRYKTIRLPFERPVEFELKMKPWLLS